MSVHEDLLNNGENNCSFTEDEVDIMCSKDGDDACGVGSSDAVLWKIRKIGMLNHKMLWFEGKNWSKK